MGSLAGAVLIGDAKHTQHCLVERQAAPADGGYFRSRRTGPTEPKIKINFEMPVLLSCGARRRLATFRATLAGINLLGTRWWHLERTSGYGRR